MENQLKKLVQNTKAAQISSREKGPKERSATLYRLEQRLRERQDEILMANQKDCAEAQARGLSGAMVDRLLLTESRIEQMAKGVRSIAEQPEVLGLAGEPYRREDGLVVNRERIPLGVIGMIFESRPNVIIDCAALAIKSGNGMVLKGGKEAQHSNEILGQIVKESLEPDFSPHFIQVLPSQHREVVSELISLTGLIDLVIPRGGEALIRFVYENAKVPVVAHFKGLCHIYIHEDAETAKALEICLNAKLQRPGVCNAMESLLVHEKLASSFLKNLLEIFHKEGVEIRGCQKSKELFPFITVATEEDYHTEYLDKILSLKLVSSAEEAILHIQEHGTGHTEGICAENPQVIEEFRKRVDASCLTVNASTRFNDGGELGLGAELGISTTKIHAYGPMGAKEMTTTRFLVQGKGHIRK